MAKSCVWNLSESIAVQGEAFATVTPRATHEYFIPTWVFVWNNLIWSLNFKTQAVQNSPRRNASARRRVSHEAETELAVQFALQFTMGYIGKLEFNFLRKNGNNNA